MTSCSILNDQSDWRVDAAWFWSQAGHINELESRSLVALFRALVQEGGDSCFSALLDSRVAKGAHAKGRSSARALRPSLLRAYVLAGNFHPALGVAPTRLNTADAPTRDRPLPGPAEHLILDFLSPQHVASLNSRQFSKGVSGWIRLYILVIFCLCPGEVFSAGHLNETVSSFWISQFAAPISVIGFSLSNISWTFHGAPPGKYKCRPQGWFGPILKLALVLCVAGCEAMPLEPSGSGETGRAARRSGNILQADRVVLQQTRDRRQILLSAFDQWLVSKMRITLEALLDGPLLDGESVSETFVAYGKDMYQEGKSYNVQ